MAAIDGTTGQKLGTSKKKNHYVGHHEDMRDKHDELAEEGDFHGLAADLHDHAAGLHRDVEENDGHADKALSWSHAANALSHALDAYGEK